MATAVIRIDGVVGSDTDLELGSTITFSNNDDTGVSTWAWTLLDKPVASSATLTAPTAATTDLTLDVEGTFLVRLNVNSGESIDSVVAAVRGVRSRIRWAAAGETTQADATRGWAVDENDGLIKVDNLISAGAVQVGIIPTAEAPPDGVSWKRGNIVAASSVSDIDPSAGGTETVPIWRKPATIEAAGEQPWLIGAVLDDTDGNTSFNQAVSNVPGVTGRVVNVVVQGFVKGVTGALDFTDATIFPEGVNAGDPLWADTITGAHELTNINDYFGTDQLNGGSAGDFAAQDDRDFFVGYVVDNGNPGSIYVTQPVGFSNRTSPFRIDSGIICHSLRLGHSTSQEGNYAGRRMFRTAPGALEIEAYDISNGAGGTMVRFDIVSLRDTDTGSGNARTEMLSAHLVDTADNLTHSYLGMITDVGASPNTGRSIKATVFGMVRGCASAFPGGATNGEVLYADPGTNGKLVRVGALSATDPRVAVGRIISTTIQSGQFFVGPDSNLRMGLTEWTDAGTFLYPADGATEQVVIGGITQNGAGQYALEVQGALSVEGDDNSRIIFDASAAGDVGFDLTVTAGAAGNAVGTTAPAGGDVLLTGGTGGGDPTFTYDGGAGGTITLTGGVGGAVTGGAGLIAGAGGALALTAGTGGATTAGTAGEAIGGAGGAINLVAGTGSDGDAEATSTVGGTGGAGGTISLTAGTGGGGDAGDANSAGPGGAAGTISIAAGDGGVPAAGASGAQAGVAGGNVAITAGDGSDGVNSGANGGAGGAISLTGGIGGADGGAATDGVGGAVTITAGAAKAASNGNGGAVTINAGAGQGTGTNGKVIVGSANTAGVDINGTISLLDVGAPASLAITGPTATSGNALAVQLIGGDGGSSDGTGGDIDLVAGDGGTTNGDGGAITLNGGTAAGSGADGDVLIANLRGNVEIASTGNSTTIKSLEALFGSLALAFKPLRIDLTVNAESANVITVDIQVDDVNGTAVSQAVLLRARMFDDTNFVTLSANFDLAETGAGAEHTGTGTGDLTFVTSAAGAAQLSVTDAVGGSNTTVFLLITDNGNSAGVPMGVKQSLTFDAV